MLTVIQVTKFESSHFRSLNDNQLTGEIPDAFQSLTQLTNL
jgi:hypothetical protein